MQDEEHSILVSSHITSDLEKVADYIVFMHAGKIIFCMPKGELLEHYGIMKCGAAQFDAIDKDDMIAYRKQDYEWRILVANRQKAAKKYPKAMVTAATIDEIMLHNGIVFSSSIFFVKHDAFIQMIIAMQLFLFIVNAGALFIGSYFVSVKIYRHKEFG